MRVQNTIEWPVGSLDEISFAIGALLSLVLSFVIFRVRWAMKKHALGKQKLRESRATIRGQVAEQLAPLLPEFPYASADARFLGAPVDYVVFDGLSDDDEIEVVLVEVKSGKARLSRREKRVQEAVKRGRVRYEIVRVVKD